VKRILALAELDRPTWPDLVSSGAPALTALLSAIEPGSDLKPHRIHTLPPHVHPHSLLQSKCQAWNAVVEGLQSMRKSSSSKTVPGGERRSSAGSGSNRVRARNAVHAPSSPASNSATRMVKSTDGEAPVAGIRTLSEIEARIRIVEDNIRQLIEQAAATSGAETEALVSDRIAQQTEELERLTHERDALAKKTS
jgi:hypothetical protein